MAVINGTAASEVLINPVAGQTDAFTGGAGDDTITGNGGADTFYMTTGDGNDTITDFLHGNDILRIDTLNLISIAVVGGNTIVTTSDGTVTMLGVTDITSSDIISIEDMQINGTAGADSITLTTENQGATVHGANGNDTINGTQTNLLSVFGDDGADVITASNSTISGGNGDDSLSGANPTMEGGAGNDTIRAVDTFMQWFLAGDDGNDSIISANGVSQSIEGGIGNDTVTASNYNVMNVLGGDGNDRITISGGRDPGGFAPVRVVDGGNDNDVITIQGFSGFTVDGGAGNDIVRTGDDADTLQASTGNDTLSGGAAADLFNFDMMTYATGFGVDWITDFNLAQDTMDLTGTASIDTTHDGLNTVLFLTDGLGNHNIITLEGLQEADVVASGQLVGTVNHISVTPLKPTAIADNLTVRISDTTTTTNLVTELLSNDTDPQASALHITSVNTSGTHGTVTFDLADQTLFYNPYGTDLWTTDSFTYVATNASGVSARTTVNITLHGNGTPPGMMLPWYGTLKTEGSGGSVETNESEWINGTAMADTITALHGYDTIIGFAGSDLLYGNQGNDIIYSNEGNDVVYGGYDNDTLYGGQGQDFLYGNQGNDLIFGNKGDDFLHGGKDNDYLEGGEGADLLNGGMGNDTLVGGAGADIFFFDSLLSNGTDIIQDFTQGKDILAVYGAIYTHPLEVLMHMRIEEGYTVVSFGTLGEVLLLGVQGVQLSDIAIV